jgi:hypothetical protein
VCLGEGDLPNTEASARVGSSADVIKLIRANANRDRTEIEHMTINLHKSFELSDKQKQLMSSILKENERLTTQIVSLQDSEAALKALVGPGQREALAKALLPRSGSGRARDFSGGALTAAERCCQHRAVYAVGIARSSAHYITAWPLSSGGLVD